MTKLEYKALKQRIIKVTYRQVNDKHRNHTIFFQKKSWTMKIYRNLREQNIYRRYGLFHEKKASEVDTRGGEEAITKIPWDNFPEARAAHVPSCSINSGS